MARKPMFKCEHLKWLVIPLFLALVILSLVFISDRLDWVTDTNEACMALAAAGGAFGAWITGLALFWVAYQQWQLRRDEHDLLHNPKIIVQSVSEPKLGPGVYSGAVQQIEYPYRIEWTVSIQNTSEIPMFVEYAYVLVEQADAPKQPPVILTPPSCHMVADQDLDFPLLVSREAPRQISWIVEGANAGSAFSHVANEHTNPHFRLRCKVFARSPKGSTGLMESTTASHEFLIPNNAPWGPSCGRVRAV